MMGATGMRERRLRERAERRATILAAARDVFRRMGYAATTIPRIAEAAEPAPDTLYLHFHSRGSAALIRRTCSGTIASWDGVRPANGSRRRMKSWPNRQARDMDLGSYGFRHDPMQWALSADSLDGAWVRTAVLKQPKPGDADIMSAEIGRIFARQKADGHIGDNTAGALMRLLDLGCAPEKPELRRALGSMCDQQIQEHGELKCYELNIACRAGWQDGDGLRKAMANWNEEFENIDFWGACPWSGEVQLQTLWSGREHADVTENVERALVTMRDHLKDGRHWPIYLDPFGWLECMGRIDNPIAKEIVFKMIPMILRAQADDGSWGGEEHLGYGPGSRTFVVFRALHKWELIEPLRGKPPLPPEWKISRTIPAPAGDLRTMTWDGNRLWVYDKASGQAIAISPEDGKKLHTVTLPPDIGGIAWSKDALLATRVKPEAVLFIDPETRETRQEVTGQLWGEFSAIAELDHRICIGNVYCGGVHFLTDGKISDHPQWLAGGFTVDMACIDGAVWHIDAFNRLLILSDPNQAERLLDWARAPFGEDTAGIAWDGKSLWALDSKKHRISLIERANKSDAGDGE